MSSLGVCKHSALAQLGASQLRSQALPALVVRRTHACVLNKRPRTLGEASLVQSLAVPAEQPLASAFVQVESARSSSATPTSVQSRNILVAIDHSEDSWRAVSWTLQNIYKEGDTVHLINVIPQGFANVQQPTTVMYGPPEDGDVVQMVESSKDYLQRAFMSIAQEVGVPRFEIGLVHGKCRESIGAAICKKAANLQAAMVVISGRQMTLWEELFIGSFSRHVAQHCQQPTIILH